MKNNLKSLKQVNRIQCILALVVSFAVAYCVFAGITMRIVTNGTDAVKVSGMNIYRMFTILSNTVCAVCSLLTMSYCIEGLRHQNYHMPKRIVMVEYVGTATVAVTFLISVFILSPVVGYKNILFTGSNLFLHLIAPVLAIILFIFINPFHTIKFKGTWIAMAPVLIYAVVYMIMVFFVKKWDDYYCFNKFIPWPVTAVLIIPFAFGICTIIRVLHNKMHKVYRKKLRLEINNCYEFSLKTIDDAIEAIANKYRKLEKGGDIVVPRMMISMLKDKYQSKLSLDELCALYIKYYFK